MQNVLKSNFFLSLLTGLLLIIAFPFSGSLTPLVFVAWVPFFYIAIQLKEKKRAWLPFFAYAYLSVFLFNLGTTWWIWNSTMGGAIMAFVCNSLLMAFALTIGFRLFKSLPTCFFLLGLGLSWIVFEFLHLNWELSWPWLTLGNFFSIHPSWVQWYEYTGTLGGSFWVMAVNVLCTLLLLNRKSVPNAIVLASLISMPFIWSFFLNRRVERCKYPTQSVIILQPNIDPYTEKFNTDPVVQLSKMIELVQPYLKNNPLVIGPETALQETFVEENFAKTQSFNLLQKSIIKNNCSLLIGASTFQLFTSKKSSASKRLYNGQYYESYNTALFLNKKNAQFIHKSKLVLGVEKIPFSQWFPILEKWSIDNGGTSGSLGVETHPKTFKNGSNVYAPIICYESIYGAFVAEQVKKGAQLLCIITNDGWWGNTPGHRQHNQFAALRAIETRKYVVRSGNTGISSVWNSHGQCLNRTQYNEKTILHAKVPLLKGKTFYVKYGDYMGWVSFFAFLALLAYRFFRLRKQ